jgi:hypothetical protein
MTAWLGVSLRPVALPLEHPIAQLAVRDADGVSEWCSHIRGDLGYG